MANSSSSIPPAAASGVRMCPNCGALVSPGANTCGSCGTRFPTTGTLVSPPIAAVVPTGNVIPPDADKTYIMIWGPHAVGKTMFLFMLRDELRAMGSDWDVTAVGDAASDFWDGLTDLKYEHHFAGYTLLGTHDEMIFEFSCKDQRKIDKIVRYVVVEDMTGEWFENRKRAIDVDGKNVIDENLKKSKGLLCLIDPTGISEGTAKHLDKLLMRLQTLCGKPTDKRLALCLTKMDDRRYRNRLADRAALIREILGDGVMAEIDKTFHPDKINYFATSAVGFYPATSPPRSNSGIDWQGRGIIYEIQHIKPFGLVRSFFNWLVLES